MTIYIAGVMVLNNFNKTAINVALLCPFSTGPTRGNMTTVSRIANHLKLTGCDVTLLPLDIFELPAKRKVLSQISPDLLHAFHAHHAGPTARLLAREMRIPYMITITGSDLFDPIFQNEASTRQAVQDAAAVSCFDSLVARHLAEVFPQIVGRISIIPQGVTPLPLSKPFPHAEDEFIILLPAAIRPVKGITSALEALTPLAKTFPSLRLLLAGGDLDPVYADMIREKAAILPWVRMLGEVPYQLMGDLFAASDLVLNCSLFEGGMSNSLLEAMVMGKPVLAHDVLGNRSLISHGKTGWLYRNDDGLRDLVHAIFNNPTRGIQIGEAGRKYVQKHCSTTKEAEEYFKVYKRLRLIHG